MAGDLALTGARLRTLTVAPSGVIRATLGRYPFTAAQTAVLDGRCEITLAPGFDPLRWVTAELSVVSAAQVTGRFAEVVMPPAPVVGIYEWREGEAGVSIVYDVFDYNGDGEVDDADLGAFFARWEVGDPYADVNGVRGVDSDDVAFFLVGWEAGGR